MSTYTSHPMLHFDANTFTMVEDCYCCFMEKVPSHFCPSLKVAVLNVDASVLPFLLFLLPT